ncbi:uncharacterized protein BO80DRAFT_428190 [Aspergillus ibericus CBS 121593]|uniref:Uncharacterized protein n=1 Tax=Aspergillus ibericus CBS 121593 TaxID=1448316 RepID=A0A395GRD4_9EURO|nr:hypothetical protein BO80DRAFT_428190 [Aspergillus ibericus CBS 121593]RAK97518.1 hypothetical protein BO80DRAFT_428190 [Aspergillus ibericus CBS 121593]
MTELVLCWPMTVTFSMFRSLGSQCTASSGVDELASFDLIRGTAIDRRAKHSELVSPAADDSQALFSNLRTSYSSPAPYCWTVSRVHTE